ncbi:hypothetical protein NL676_016333 [Syzygium grande]|nr:hypothetical protein NL676_016333 [Syzygium grande]
MPNILEYRTSLADVWMTRIMLILDMIYSAKIFVELEVISHPNGDRNVTSNQEGRRLPATWINPHDQSDSSGVYEGGHDQWRVAETSTATNNVE